MTTVTDSELSLAALQRAVQSLLLRPRSAPDGFIVETNSVPRATRLGIYANAYRVRLIEALAADYSGLKNYLGDAEFENLVDAYIGVYPSRQFSLRYVGQHLGDFLRATPPYNEHVDLYELAQFEWALCHAFDAADCELLTIDDLRGIDPQFWPALRLQFHPSLRRLSLFGNAPALWAALNTEQPLPAYQRDGGERAWIVWRHQLRLLFRPLAEHEPLVLEAFYAGAEFADVCERVGEVVEAEKVPALVAGLMQQWLQEGLVAKGE